MAKPYSVAADSRFRWFRSRIIGGRTNHYGRISLRFSDYDFKPYSFDGLGADWPISYEEMSPYYDKAEEFIGVTGSKEGLRTAARRKVSAAHRASRARKYNSESLPETEHPVRPIAHGDAHPAGSWAGCLPLLWPVRPRLPDRIGIHLESGNDLSRHERPAGSASFTGAMARELITNDAGRVMAISYVDKGTRTEKQIRCRRR
jgi:choline dehydrogenase-like flavoprotein